MMGARGADPEGGLFAILPGYRTFACSVSTLAAVVGAGRSSVVRRSVATC